MSNLEIPNFPDDITMNIYAKPGTKVKVTEQTAKNGLLGDKEQVQRLLDIGKEYTVAYTEVGQSRTIVYLQELPGERFNSVNFIEIEAEEKNNEILR